MESALIEFFSECDEILQRFSSKLAEVEKGSSNPDTIGALYRDMHTLKGSAQLFGFHKTAQVAHAVETSLEPIRRFNLQIPESILDSLFKSVELIEEIIKNSQGSKQEIPGNAEEHAKIIIPKLLSAASHFFGGEMIAPYNAQINFSENKLFNTETQSQTTAHNSPNSETSHSLKPTSSPDELEKKVPPSMLQESRNSLQQSSTEPKPALDSIDPVNTPKEVKETNDNSDANSTVRIQVALLDRLMNLVGEMVLVRNQMLQYGQKHDALEFLNLSQRLDAVTSELQGEVMKTRMQPIASILSKFQRVIRDLAKDLSKQIELSVQGAETELDKTQLEAIKDPLTHIVRNSCDHGLETPEERKKAGKPASGKILIRAFHEGGNVIIEVIDDGRGLNPQKILAKALDKKLISTEHSKNLSERDMMNLIFAPGFSTAEKITAVSGRGVGMDVVKTNIERVGGQVELQSEMGRGMTIRLRIPLTLAIVPALVVKTAGEQFAIPQLKLSELVRVGTDNHGSKIEILQGRPVFRLRGQLVSLIYLKDILGIEPNSPDPNQVDSVNIIVLNGEGETFGLIVDEIKDTADIVVKPLPHFLKKLQIYSGATIMGDGSVALILDVVGLAAKGRIQQKASKENLMNPSATSTKAKDLDLEQQDFLFFKLNSSEKYCLPLCLVNRLEEFPYSAIEQSGKQRIVQYRDSILPIISLNEFFGFEPASQNLSDSHNQNRSISVIVVQKNLKQYGIEVNEVADIINVRRNIEDPIREIKGILGGIIMGEEVATVIDVYGILHSVVGASEKSKAPHLSNSNPKTLPEETPPKAIHILFAEDTVFFMKQVKKVLEKAGYTVAHASDGEKAWTLLNSSKTGEFNLILTDIEMPNMNGFELADRIRKSEKFSKLPMIALTTRFRQVDQKKGQDVGFNRYLEKLRSDELLRAVEEVLENPNHV